MVKKAENFSEASGVIAKKGVGRYANATNMFKIAENLVDAGIPSADIFPGEEFER